MESRLTFCHMEKLKFCTFKIIKDVFSGLKKLSPKAVFPGTSDNFRHHWN